MHEENSFITLTYNDDNIPENGSLRKRDLQLFFKRLRKSLPNKRIRYYACGEYGEELGRPHYHACLFGHDFEDKEEIEQQQHARFKNKFKTGIDHQVYRSESLEKVWQLGYSGIGALTFESAGYTARYVAKKITGNDAEKHYNGKAPEFAIMSRRPGLGLPWYEKFKGDVYPKDFFTLRGIKMQPPLYYDTQLKRENFALFEEIKAIRIEKHKKLTQKRMHEIEKHTKAVTKTLKRRLENAGIGYL
jgi:hypothetical protein